MVAVPLPPPCLPPWVVMLPLSITGDVTAAAASSCRGGAIPGAGLEQLPPLRLRKSLQLPAVAFDVVPDAMPKPFTEQVQHMSEMSGQEVRSSTAAASATAAHSSSIAVEACG